MTKSEKRIEKKRNKNFSLIKEKKLIICKEDLYKLNANDIKKVYPYTVEIINNREEFEKRFLSDENAYFFFLYKWEIKGQSKYKHCFYNNKNNSVIFYQPSVAFTRSVTSSMYLSKKTLKKLISLINKP